MAAQATATGLAVIPSTGEALLAEETSHVLTTSLEKSGTLRLRLTCPGEPTVEIPAYAVRILIRTLDETARGNAVTLMPVRAELTTQQAADMLNVSRPTLIQLLDEGKIAHRRVGTHRRVRFDSLMAYKRQAEADRRSALEELAAYDQEIGL